MCLARIKCGFNVGALGTGIGQNSFQRLISKLPNLLVQVTAELGHADPGHENFSHVLLPKWRKPSRRKLRGERGDVPPSCRGGYSPDWRH